MHFAANGRFVCYESFVSLVERNRCIISVGFGLKVTTLSSLKCLVMYLSYS